MRSRKPVPPVDIMIMLGKREGVLAFAQIFQWRTAPPLPTSLLQVISE